MATKWKNVDYQVIGLRAHQEEIEGDKQKIATEKDFDAVYKRLLAAINETLKCQENVAESDYDILTPQGQLLSEKILSEVLDPLKEATKNMRNLKSDAKEWLWS
jgi:hypothetical protein